MLSNLGQLKSVFFILTIVITYKSVANLNCIPLFSISEAPEFLTENWFTTNRNLNQYFKELVTGGLKDKLTSSVQPIKWLDAGAGQAIAIRDTLKNKKFQSKIDKAYSVVYKKPNDGQTDLNNDIELFKNKFMYIEGDYIENLFSEGKLKDLEGNLDIITDLFGPLTYTKDLSKVVEIYLKLLKKGGELEFNIGLMNTSGNPWLYLQFIDSNGKKINNAEEVLQEWFSKIKGVEIIKQDISGFNDYSINFLIRKISDNIEIPKFIFESYDDLLVPPFRTFKLPPP